MRFYLDLIEFMKTIQTDRLLLYDINFYQIHQKSR